MENRPAKDGLAMRNLFPIPSLSCLISHSLLRHLFTTSPVTTGAVKLCNLLKIAIAGDRRVQQGGRLFNPRRLINPMQVTLSRLATPETLAILAEMTMVLISSTALTVTTASAVDILGAILS